jgi:hypothetical protein
MNLEQEYKIYHVSSGQAAPYADSKDVVRVEHIRHDFYHNTQETCWPTVFNKETRKFDPELGKQRMFEIALKILGWDNFRERKDVRPGDIEDHFRGWGEVYFVSEGVIELVSVSPFND